MKYTACPLYGIQSKKMLKYILHIKNEDLLKQERVASMISPYVDTIKNSLRKKIVTEYEFLRNNPDDTKSRQRLRGLITAARQVDKSAFPNISKFAFDSFHSQ